MVRLRAVPLRSVTSKFGRTGDSELTKRGTGERREEEGLPSLLNQTCSGNSAHHQRRQLVKNKLICHLISNNSASICRALNPHGLLSTANVCFSSWTQIHQKKEVVRKGRGRKPNLEARPLYFAEYVRWILKRPELTSLQRIYLQRPSKNHLKFVGSNVFHQLWFLLESNCFQAKIIWL